MSQAVIDFCEGLKTALLGVEDRVGKAQTALARSAGTVEKEAAKQLEHAAKQLKGFRIEAAGLAGEIRRGFPAQAAGAQKALNEFGAEAQTAIRQMLVMMADAASTGADTAAHALEAGARSARKFAVETREPGTKRTAAKRKGSGKRKPAARSLAARKKQPGAARRAKRS